MAIFTNQHDRVSVPLLTQLAQIDTASEAELRHAYSLLIDPDMPDGGMCTSDSPEGLAIVAEVCDTIGRTFRALATEYAVPADCLAWMNRKGRGTAHVLKVFKVERDEPDAADRSLVPAEAIDLGFEGEQNPDVVQRVIAPLQMWVAVAISPGGESMFAICPECGNPFAEMSQTKQTYCSRRCAARVGQRRRYQPRKPKV